MRSPLPLATALMWGLSIASIARGAGPADALFRLVPPDAGLAVAVENLRDRSREIAESPLADGLRRLPAVRSWLGSGPIRGVRQLVRQAEEALDVPPGAIRDELFGDAVVLALRLGPPAAPERARGLLLGRARDRDLLDRLIDGMNQSQTASGELAGVVRKAHGTGSYSTRTYSQGARPEEFYATFDDGTFAWSNSADLLKEVLDRKASGGPSLADDPGFKDVRGKLPKFAAISVYVAPRMIEASLFGDGRGDKSLEGRLGGMIARYVGATTALGVAVEWKDGVAIHAHEAIDPKKLDDWLRAWLTRPSPPASAVGPLPATTIAAVALDVDFVALRDGFLGLVPDADRPWYRNLKAALQGLLMGEDLDASLLPRLGPGVLFCLDAPTEVGGQLRFPCFGVVGVKPGPDAPGPRAAIENAIRTGTSIYALENPSKAGGLRAETREIGTARVLVLAIAGRTLLGMTSGPDRMVFGNLPELVARFGVDGSPSPLEAIRAANFPEAGTFAVVDLARLAGAIKRSRRPIAEKLAGRGRRGADAIEKDLDQVAATADLFRALTFTTTADRDATSIHRVFRLIAR